jgi:hypothetical protein
MAYQAYQAPAGQVEAVTPDCELNFAHLIEPDFAYSQKGEFNITARLGSDAVAEFEEIIAKAIETAKSEGAAAFTKLTNAQRNKLGIDEMKWLQPGSPHYDQNDSETGERNYKFKTSATVFKSGKPRVVNVFGPTGKRITGVEIQSGSTGAVSFTAKPYFMSSTGTAGVSLFLNAVQLLVQGSGYGGSSATQSGFASREGFEEIDVDAVEEDTIVNNTVISEGIAAEDMPF